MNLIDIASHQAGIDLPGIFAKNNLDGVIVKADGGTQYTNPYFKSWAKWLHDNGKPLGAYHYCRELTGSPGIPEAEARHFYDIVKPYLGWIVLAADWERMNSDAFSLGTGWLKEFLDALYSLTGVKALVYCSQSVVKEQDFTAIADAGYKLWMAQYADENPVQGFIDNPWQKGSVTPFNGYAIHQYTSNGYLNGYANNLDFDQFKGSYASWMELASGTPDVKPEPTPSTPKKADPEVVADVLAGKYGTGTERTSKLRAAGYDANDVQNKVNELYGIAMSCKKYVRGNEAYIDSISGIIQVL